MADCCSMVAAALARTASPSSSIASNTWLSGILVPSAFHLSGARSSALGSGEARFLRSNSGIPVSSFGSFMACPPAWLNRTISHPGPALQSRMKELHAMIPRKTTPAAFRNRCTVDCRARPGRVRECGILESLLIDVLSTQIPQLEAGLGSQVTVSPNEFLFFHHDNFHRVQLRRSSTWVC